MDPLSSLARRALRARLRSIRSGHLVLRDGERVDHFGDTSAPSTAIVIHDPRAYRAIALGGSVGAGEAFSEGWWTSSDLTALIRLMVRNRDSLDALERGLARGVKPLRRLWHALNRNTKRGSRRNIRAHYDLGNDFFETFLDETMTYSCGIFAGTHGSLADASRAKYERMAQLVDLQARDHLLEIGTGWAGFAIHAAQTYGCRVTTTTISRAQHAYASRRVRELGLEDRVTVLLEDYRDLRGRYDKLVSIEMIEAVGHEHFETFYATCASLLKPTGRAAIQAITIAPERYDTARREVDFIKRHIFPGSCIPSLPVLHLAAGRTDLRVERVDEIGLHYAETLRRWRQALLAERERLDALGLDARFLRLWEFYFCYCEGGFLERAIGTVQIAYAMPDATARSVQPVMRVPALPRAA